MRDERRIVCCLLSSTFINTELQRNLIITDVVPYLQVRLPSPNPEALSCLVLRDSELVYL
jgi:hypothetical protein